MFDSLLGLQSLGEACEKLPTVFLTINKNNALALFFERVMYSGGVEECPLNPLSATSKM